MSNQSKLITIVILNWNGEQYIEPCINSIRNQSYKNIEVIFIDNNSDDHSVKKVEDNYREVKVIQNNENLGFCKPNNYGMKIAKGEYVLLLNNDIILSETFISEMVKKAEVSESVGFVSGKLYRFSLEDHKKNKQQIIDTTGHIIYKNRKVIDRGQDKEEKDFSIRDDKIFSVCGAAALYRKSMLEDTKINDEYLDEDFFMYKEDIDLCWRARLMGWEGMYAQNAVAYHARGWSSKDRSKIPKSLRMHSLKNRYLMIIKNDRFSTIISHLPFILFHEIKIWGYALVKEPFLFKIWPYIIVNFKEVFKKRKYVQKRKQNNIKTWIN